MKKISNLHSGIANFHLLVPYFNKNVIFSTLEFTSSLLKRGPPSVSDGIPIGMCVDLSNYLIDGFVWQMGHVVP